jgi:zinc protease
MKRVGIAILVAASAAAAPNPTYQKSGIADWTKKPPPAAEPRFAPPVAKRMQLANGMGLLVVENHALPILSMRLVVRGAGAAVDPAGKGGLAAITADMLDEGAGGLGALQIAEEQDRLGATIAAGVDVDGAVVSVNTLAKTLEPTLGLLAKLVTQPAFDAKEFDRVKNDRAIALDLRRDRPREVAANVLVGALYGHAAPYGHPAAGSREEFKTITLADVQAFYKDHYGPAAMTLVVAGDVDPAGLKKLLDRGLGQWKAAAKPVAKVNATPAKPGKRLLLVDRPGAAQSDVRIGLVGPDRKDRRYPAFEVLRTTLGDGFTSRIVQKLREQMGIIYNGNATMGWRVQPGPFVIAVAIQTPDTARGITEIVKMLDDLATNDVPPAELEKSKQNIIRALPSLFDTNAQTAAAFADLVVHGLPDNYYAGLAAAIRKVTAKDVKDAAKALLPSSKMTFSVVGDLSKIRADLDKLGLGEAGLHDPYGVPKS